jgi:RNA polymerase sigma factor (sigma-70 family)
MNREQFTDQQIFLAIQHGGEERENVIRYLFDHAGYRAKVHEVVEKGGGNKIYASLVYENCLIQLDKIVRRKQYKSASLADFLESEARIMWCRELISNSTARKTVLENLTDDKDLQGKINASVINNSGSGEDAQDIYQNGLMLIDDHMKNGKFRGGAVKGFFYQVCYNLWRNELKRHKAISLPEDGLDLTVTTVDPQEELERKEKSELLKKLFDQLSESCQKIFRLKFFVMDKYSMDEIALQMGFKNAQIAANALSKCRKHLRELLNKHKPSFEWIQQV